MMPAAPRLPMIPEISLAKKNDSRGAAKIAVFAYHRETRQPVWQSGVAVATSTAKEAWVFGAGPIRYGTIYDNAADMWPSGLWGQNGMVLLALLKAGIPETDPFVSQMIRTLRDAGSYKVRLIGPEMLR